MRRKHRSTTPLLCFLQLLIITIVSAFGPYPPIRAVPIAPQKSFYNRWICEAQKNNEIEGSKNWQDPRPVFRDHNDVNSRGEANSSEALLREFAKDLSILAESIRPNDPLADLSFPVSIVSDGSSYTRLWTHSTWKKHSNAPHLRYSRHVFRWHKSLTARKILPAVLLSTCWATLLSVLTKLLPSFGCALKVFGSSAALSYLGAPLALLLTLRANASMSRLLEARLVWGRLVLHARSLANMVRVYLYPSDPKLSVLVARYLAIFGWVLKACVRGESYESELPVLETMLPSEEFRWFASQRKRSVALTCRIRHICSTLLLSEDPVFARNPSLLLVVEERIAELEATAGACERILSSPIPPTYSRHLSRVMVLWILLTPMSLLSQGLCRVGVAMATTIAAYVMIGIDEVGMEIENVFQLLPLQQLAAAAQNGVRDQFLLSDGETY